MSFTIILELNVKPESADAMTEWMQTNIAETKTRPGCELVEVYTDDEDNTHFVLFEKWTAAEDQANYMAWRTENGSMEVVGGMLAGPPVVTPLNFVV